MGSPALWLGFNVCVLALLALDVGLVHRRAETASLSSAAFWSALWITLSLGFNLWILRTHGSAPALEFFTGYLIEKSLSIDNVFIFLLVFRAFGVQPQFQHRVLFLGVLGALVLRGLMIAAGTALIHRYSWILYVFGGLLVVAGVRLLFHKSRDFHPERNRLLQWARRLFPMAQGETGGRFFVIENRRRAVTTLFLALIVLEGADLLFALDSIPAVFGITRDPFIVYSSNVCALLGMRALYFLIAGVVQWFRYLDAGLSMVLIFVGGKMLAEPWIHVPTLISLGVVAGMLGIAVAASLVAGRTPPQTLSNQ